MNNKQASSAYPVMKVREIMDKIRKVPYTCQGLKPNLFVLLCVFSNFFSKQNYIIHRKKWDKWLLERTF
jgi:flavin-dependent dehydrogenase